MREQKHIELLVEKYGFNGDIRKLKRVEKLAHQIGLDACNVGITDEDRQRRENHVEKRVIELFGKLPEGFLINGDPRGYALKIDPEKRVEGLESDWGGYGILCPEF